MMNNSVLEVVEEIKVFYAYYYYYYYYYLINTCYGHQIAWMGRIL